MDLKSFPASEPFDAQSTCHRLATFAGKLVLLQFVFRLENLLAFDADDLVNVFGGVASYAAARLKVLPASVANVSGEMCTGVYVQYG